jgi:hypothetical protein
MMLLFVAAADMHHTVMHGRSKTIQDSDVCAREGYFCH